MRPVRRTLRYVVCYSCPVDASCRSCMNVSIRIGGPDGNEQLEKKFVTEAGHQGMIHLNGHRYRLMMYIHIHRSHLMSYLTTATTLPSSQSWSSIVWSVVWSLGLSVAWECRCTTRWHWRTWSNWCGSCRTFNSTTQTSILQTDRQTHRQTWLETVIVTHVYLFVFLLTFFLLFCVHLNDVHNK